jgi:hypothetical protein
MKAAKCHSQLFSMHFVRFNMYASAPINFSGICQNYYSYNRDCVKLCNDEYINVCTRLPSQATRNNVNEY